MKDASIDKIAFVVSLTLLAFLYGFATSARQWFPNDLLVQAWDQAEALTGNDLAWLATRVYDDRSGTRVEDTDRIQPGLTLIVSKWAGSGWDNGARLIDEQGNVLHEWHIDGAEVFPDPPDQKTRFDPGNTNTHGAYLFPDGSLLLNLDFVGTVRVDACSEVMWRLPEGSHHSVARADDGSFWISAGSWEPPEARAEDARSYPGLNPSYWDRILRVSEKGEVLEEHNVLDIIFENGLEYRIPATSSHNAFSIFEADLTHLNDVEPLPSSLAEEYPLFSAGDLLVSLRQLDLVFVFAPSSGRVKWHSTKRFIAQHDPDFIGGGWIGVFDNRRDATDRGTMLGGSRIVAIQPHTDSSKVLFPTQNSEPFYTEVMGKWQKMANGNLLLTESRAGRVVEVTPDGETVWEWVTEPYDDERIPEVTEGSRYDLTAGEVAGWPCSPSVSNTNRTKTTA